MAEPGGEPGVPRPLLTPLEPGATREQRLRLLDDFVRLCEGVADADRLVRSARPFDQNVVFSEALQPIIEWTLDMVAQPPEAQTFHEDLARRTICQRYRFFWNLYVELLCRTEEPQAAAPQAAHRRVQPDDARPNSWGDIMRKLSFCWEVCQRVEALQANLVELHRLHRNRMDFAVPGELNAGGIYASITRLHDRDDKASDFEKLLKFLLECAAKHRFRKLGGLVYAERTVDIHGTRYGTHAWEPVVFNSGRPDSEASTIATFMYKFCRKEERFDMWRRLVALRSPHSLIQHLTDAEEIEFPFLKRKRNILSFQNGIFDTADPKAPGTFYPYQSAHQHLGADVVAAKFFDQAIDPRWFEIAAQTTNGLGWWDIETPRFQSILDYQNFGCVLQPEQPGESSGDELDGDDVLGRVPSPLPPGLLEESVAKRMLSQLENAFTSHFYELRHAQPHEVPDHLEALCMLARQFEEDLRARKDMREAVPQEPSEHAKGSERRPGNSLPADAQRWVYIMMGRLLHEVGAFDNFQIMPFIKGVANSGKSTAAHIVKHFFAPCDVGVLSNNSEAKFGLSALYDKFCFVCFELKKTVTLSAAEFQSMVSGEDCSIAIKHATAQTHRWKPPGFLVGNEAPGWADCQGSIARRLLIINFRYGVNNKDSRPELLQEIMDHELAAIIVKCNIAYRTAAAVHSGEDIWKVLPQYFHDERRNLLRDSDPLYSTIWDKFHWELFINAPPDSKYEDYFTLWDDFEQDYKMRFRGMRGTQYADPLIDDRIGVPFGEAGLRKQMCSKPINGVEKTDLYILGIRPRRRAHATAPAPL